MLWNSCDQSINPNALVGMNVHDAMDCGLGNAQASPPTQPVDEILSGRIEEHSKEFQSPSTGHWFRSRYLPLLRRTRNAGVEGESVLDGAAIITIDTTGKYCLDSLTLPSANRSA